MKSSGKSRTGEVLMCIYNGLSLLCWARFSNQGQLPDAGSENPGGWVHSSPRFFQVGERAGQQGHGKYL